MFWTLVGYRMKKRNKKSSDIKFVVRINTPSNLIHCLFTVEKLRKTFKLSIEKGSVNRSQINIAPTVRYFWVTICYCRI